MVNRSVERRQWPVSGTVPDQLQAGTFIDPARGQVRCSAAPVLVAGLRRAGHQAVRARRPFELNPEAPDGVLFAASYLERTGRAVGLCVAAHNRDRAGLLAAREAVNTWSAVWRTRWAVLASTNQSCVDARQPTENAGQVVSTEPFDITCPHVTLARSDVQLFERRGDQVIVIGKRGHAALQVLIGHASDDVVVVESGNDVTDLRLDPDRVAYVVQPGVPIENAARVIAALRARYPRVRGAHPDGFCYAASDHAATVHAVAASSDTLFVLGSENHPDSAELLKHTSAAPKVHLIDDVDQIRPAWLAGAANVGLVQMPSAPPDLEHDVLEILSGLGPLSVVRRRMTTEVLPAWHASSDLGRELARRMPGPAGRRPGNTAVEP